MHSKDLAGLSQTQSLWAYIQFLEFEIVRSVNLEQRVRCDPSHGTAKRSKLYHLRQAHPAHFVARERAVRAPVRSRGRARAALS